MRELLLYRSKSLFLYVTVFSLIICSGWAQISDEEQIYARQRSFFIYNFIRQVGWPDTESFKVFKMGVLNDRNLYNELIKNGNNRQIIGKPVEVYHFENIEEVRPCQLLYVNKSSGHDLDSIYDRISGKQTLLISENFSFEGSMINIVSAEGSDYQFEINEKMMNREGFIMSPSLSKFAVSAADRWHEMYELSKKSLEEEKIKVAEQRDILEKQRLEIEDQNRLLEERKVLVAKQLRELEIKGNELNVKNAEIESKNEIILDLQQNFINKSNQLDSLGKLIGAQENRFNEQRKEVYLQDSVLELQIERISAQNKLLEDQEKILGQQRSQLELQSDVNMLLFVVIGLVVIIAIIVYVNYRNTSKINKRLIKLNNEKNELIGVVSHDLRNPLNQIKGMANLLVLDGGENLKESQQEYVNNVMESCDRLMNMITRILDVNAIESNKINIKLDESDLEQLVKMVSTNCQLIAVKKEIEIESVSESSNTKALVDKNYLIQVLENLVSNAVKFSEKGKSITLRVRDDKKHVLILVEDRGPGISQEDQLRMFQSFEKLTARPTDGESSHGLGLSIVKRYVEAMNGKIEVESQLGKGTAFILSFPKVT